MLPTIVCIAKSREHAGQVVDRLEAGNVNLADTFLLYHPRTAVGAQQQAARTESATAATGTKTGAASGAAAGAAVAAASLAVPGLQPLLVTAPLASLAGAILGAIFGAGTALAQLADLGVIKSRQEYYQARVEAGGYLVAVRTEDEAALTRALRVFEEAHATDIELFRLTKKLT